MQINETLMKSHSIPFLSWPTFLCHFIFCQLWDIIIIIIYPTSPIQTTYFCEGGVKAKTNHQSLTEPHRDKQPSTQPSTPTDNAELSVSPVCMSLGCGEDVEEPEGNQCRHVPTCAQYRKSTIARLCQTELCIHSF